MAISAVRKVAGAIVGILLVLFIRNELFTYFPNALSSINVTLWTGVLVLLIPTGAFALFELLKDDW